MYLSMSCRNCSEPTHQLRHSHPLTVTESAREAQGSTEVRLRQYVPLKLCHRTHKLRHFVSPGTLLICLTFLIHTHNSLNSLDLDRFHL